MRLTKQTKHYRVEGDMTPMIDMTFQLIAFFMVLLNFTDAEQDQRIKLPESELARPPEEAYAEPLTVQLMSDGDAILGTDEIPFSQLARALRQEAQFIRVRDDKRLADVTVIIRAAADVETGLVQEVIQMCQGAEFDSFALRAQRSNQPTLQLPETDGLP